MRKRGRNTQEGWKKQNITQKNPKKTSGWGQKRKSLLHQEEKEKKKKKFQLLSQLSWDHPLDDFTTVYTPVVSKCQMCLVTRAVTATLSVQGMLNHLDVKHQSRLPMTTHCSGRVGVRPWPGCPPAEPPPCTTSSLSSSSLPPGACSPSAPRPRLEAGTSQPGCLWHEQI